MLNRRHRMVVALMASSVSAVAAQGRVSCPGGAVQASLGAVDLDCVQCTLHSGTGSPWVEYGTEPTVKRSQSYNANALRAGDVIVSVDGALITTAAGARRFAMPAPSKAATVVVRRNGQPVSLSITPTLRCAVGVAMAGAVADSSTRFRLNYVRDSAGGFIVRRPGGDTVYVSRGDSIIAIPSVLSSPSGRAGFAAGVAARAALADSTIPRQAAIGGARAGRGGGGVGARIVDSATAAALRERLGTAVISRRGVVSDSAIASLPVDRLSAAFGAQRAGVQARAAVADSVQTVDRAHAQFAFQPSEPAGRGGFLGTAEPTTMSSGWLGFGFDCSNCSVETGSDGRRLWRFPTAPAIAGVEPGSAAELAGLQVGDVVREIDGVSLTWPAGAARFSAIKPGQKVKLTIVRKGKAQEVTMTARARVTRT